MWWKTKLEAENLKDVELESMSKKLEAVLVELSSAWSDVERCEDAARRRGRGTARKFLAWPKSNFLA